MQQGSHTHAHTRTKHKAQRRMRKSARLAHAAPKPVRHSPAAVCARRGRALRTRRWCGCCAKARHPRPQRVRARPFPVRARARARARVPCNAPPTRARAPHLRARVLHQHAAGVAAHGAVAAGHHGGDRLLAVLAAPAARGVRHVGAQHHHVLVLAQHLGGGASSAQAVSKAATRVSEQPARAAHHTHARAHRPRQPSHGSAAAAGAARPAAPHAGGLQPGLPPPPLTGMKRAGLAGSSSSFAFTPSSLALILSATLAQYWGLRDARTHACTHTSRT